MSFSPRKVLAGEPRSLPVQKQASGEPSSRAMEIIRSLDSRSFGFLDFQNSTAQSAGESTSHSSTSFVSKDFIKQGISKLCRDLSSGPQSDTFKSEVYCQLGHLHLLLEEYSDALSAYQQYQTLTPVDSLKNANLHYGMGLIYFSINSYRWAIQSFNEVLALSPDFARKSEILLRLGVMFKTKAHYSTSINHFKQALDITGPSSFSKLEIHFHLGHIHYLQGHYVAAKETFEGILAKKNVPNYIKAMALRQLGWLYHTVPEIASLTENAITKTAELLKLAVGADPSSSQAWYFLGRCHAAQGRAREAFLSYQQAVNKATDNQADVWCSIGILYHNMGQPKDSLQSYLCAVYLNPSQHETWTDMGCLYEAVSQPIDALLAYKNAISIVQKKQVDDKSSQYVYSRIMNLEQYITMVGPSLLQNQPHTLLPLKEAWYSLVPSHIKNSKPAEGHIPMLDLQSLQSSLGPPTPNSLPSFGTLPLPLGVTKSHISHSNHSTDGHVAKRQRTHKHSKDPIILRNMSDSLSSLRPNTSVPSLQDSSLLSLPQDHQSSRFDASETAGVRMSIGDLGEHDILSQPNAYTSQLTTPRVYDGAPLPQGSSDVFQPQGMSTDFNSLIGPTVCSTSAGQFQSNHSTTVDQLPFQNFHSGSIPSLLSPTHRPNSLGSKRKHYDSLSSTQSTPVSGPSLNSGVFSIGNQVPNDGLDSLFTMYSPDSVSVSSLTGFPASHSTSSILTPGVSGFNPSSTDLLSSSSHNTPSMVGPRVNLSLTDFPGDLSAISPLRLDKDGEAYMNEYLKDSSSQESLLNKAVGNGELTTPVQSVPRRSSSQTISSYLNELSHDHQTGQLPSATLLQAGSPSSPADPISIQKEKQSLTSKRFRSLENRTMSTNASTHSIPFNIPSQLESLSTVGVRETYTGSPSSPDSIDNHLSILPKSSDVCETVSDSSSGVSSAGTKLSTSSGGNSPLVSPTIATSTNLLHLSSPTHNHPFSYLGQSDDDSSSEIDELLDPIYEPYPALGNDGEYMVRDPDLKPPEPPEVEGELDLSPEVPIFEVSSRKEALSETLHGLCCNPDTPVCMIRGLCPIMELDLKLFSSKGIVQTCPDHEMEVREQVQQGANENSDPSGRKQVWKCESSRTFTTTKEYAKYQKQILSKQNDYEQETDQDDGDESRLRRRPGAPKKVIRFGTNIDLSDWDKWGRQLEELQKLPKFIRVLCPEANLLSHIGHSILGVNSAQLYMKVQGARTPGHQENHNLCSVNINIGPGGCEWFAVHNRYWGIFHKLCEKHRLSFLTGSWWPILEELRELKVPVYRFTQYEGDIVWLNPGTVHWVQANAVCNNIAWNVGPITAHQFRMAWERYMWNKVQNVRSIVPMIHLSWNIAKRLKIVDKALYLQLRSLLESSLARTHRLTVHLEKASIPIAWHSREDDEPAPCCNHCLDEVFNILFVLSHKGEYLVYCHKCATAMKKSFTVLRQYKTNELENILDSFKLHEPIFDGIHST